jgi:hypothetical protein
MCSVEGLSDESLTRQGVFGETDYLTWWKSGGKRHQKAAILKLVSRVRFELTTP